MKRPKVFRSKVKGKYVGAWKAQVYDNGKRVVWSVCDGDEPRAEAEKLAAEEWARRASAPAAIREVARPKARPLSRGEPKPLTAVANAVAKAAAPVPAPEPAPPPPDGPPAQPPVGEGQAAGAAATPTQEPAPPDPVVKLRHLHTTIGSTLAMVLEGATKRAVRWAGREPQDDFSDEQQELLREGCSELAAKWLGQTELGPAGKVAVGVGLGGVMLYMGGEPIKRPSRPKDEKPEPIGGRADDETTSDAAPAVS